MRKLATTAGVGLVALALTAPAEAVRIGPKLPQVSLFTSLPCTMADCTWVNARIEGDPVRAPFSGRIVRWRVQEPTGTFSLQVVRKVAPNTYRAIRQGTAETPPAPGAGEVVTFDEDLRVRKRDFVGLLAEDFGASTHDLATSQPADTCRLGWVPSLVTGGPEDSPDAGYSACTQLSLYNAVLKR
jgi:hypothetical protein